MTKGNKVNPTKGKKITLRTKSLKDEGYFALKISKRMGNMQALQKGFNVRLEHDGDDTAPEMGRWTFRG